jgi:hypothetical protein
MAGDPKISTEAKYRFDLKGHELYKAIKFKSTSPTTSKESGLTKEAEAH